jgi:hypothetical protein
MKRLLPIFIVSILILPTIYFACTTAVVSGKATVDGRPLLLKNRDTGFLNNRLVYFTDGKYQYIGLVNSEDSLNEQVWVGFNSAGFGIMNSASYNLRPESDSTEYYDQEGYLMKLALQKCANLEDFENLLRSMEKPLGVEANFGVIDAEGGAAYYETDNYTFKKFDVTDPEIAPDGYLIRTNYSFSGREGEGYGYIRYENTERIMERALGKDGISFETLVREVPRNLYHSLTKTDLLTDLPMNKEDETIVNFQDFVPRNSTSSASVVQGVLKGESPQFTTLWTTVGYPLSSVTFPVWLNSEESLPDVSIGGDDYKAPLCTKALKLKSEIFPVDRGSGYKYMNLSAVANKKNSGIMQKLKPVEDEIISESTKRLAEWRERGLNEETLLEFYDWLDKKIVADYKRLFGI